jgi:G2/mitotic-specific cyclin 3/4
MIPDKDYIVHQDELQWSMRSILLEWIVGVHERLHLIPETLFLCVNYIDRFLSCKIISVGKLQLVGATALFIAAKYEESISPSVGDIAYMSDNGCTVDEILKAERFMLGILQFELGWPGPMSFLRRINKADNYDLMNRTLAKYFLEVTIMDERFVGTKPSIIAAAASFLANAMYNNSGWVGVFVLSYYRSHADAKQTSAHEHFSGYTQSQLEPLAIIIIECCENFEKHRPVLSLKYADYKYKHASRYVSEIIKGGFTLLTTQLPIRYQTQPEKKSSETFTSNQNKQDQSLERIISIFPALVIKE